MVLNDSSSRHDEPGQVDCAPSPPLQLVAETGSMVDAAGAVLSEHHGISAGDALDLLVHVAAEQNRQIEAVARDVVLIGLPGAQAPIILRAGPESPLAPPAVRTPGHDGHPLPIRPSDAGGPGASMTPAEPSALLLEVLATADSPQRFLQDVVELAVRAVPGCAWAGITVVRDGSYPGTAASDERAELITRAQYLHGDGPCLRATGSGRPELIGDVRAVPPGPAWHQAALGAGVTAVMALPLHTPTADDAGVLALYAVEPGGWPPLAAERAGALAVATGRALTIADRLAAAATESRPDATAAP